MERSCERLVNYLDGQIGKTFSGSFCYEKRLTTYGRKLGKECICVKNSCNSAIDINDTEDVMLKLLKDIQSDVNKIKNSSHSINNAKISIVRRLMFFILFYVVNVLHIDKI